MVCESELEKFKMFLKKSAALCCALMAAPMVAKAQETTSDTPLTDMVNTVSLSDATSAIVAAAGVLIGLAVIVYGARKVIGFFSR